MLSDGQVITGANVENASYGLSLCAETVALAKVANQGMLGDVVEIAVTGAAEAIFPCGRCRQWLNEAAELLKEALTGKIALDFDTARRLFTLICVLHIKG